MKQIEETPDEFAHNTIYQLIKQEEPSFIYESILDNICTELKSVYNSVDNDEAAKHLVDYILKLRNPDDKTEPVQISTIDFIEHLLCWPNCLLMDYWDKTYCNILSLNNYTEDLSISLTSNPEEFAESLIKSIFTEKEWLDTDGIEALFIEDCMSSAYKQHSLSHLMRFLEMILRITDNGSSYTYPKRFLEARHKIYDIPSESFRRFNDALEMNRIGGDIIKYLSPELKENLITALIEDEKWFGC